MVYNNIQPQQTANNTQRLMKRRSNGTPLRTCLFFSHPFVGRYAFVERLFRVYLSIYQTVIRHNQQFNAFSPLNKSAVEMVTPSLPVCCRASRQSCRHNGTECHTGLAKRERQKQAADTAAGFWGTKSHSSLGRFLHAPLTLMLKTPQ